MNCDNPAREIGPTHLGPTRLGNSFCQPSLIGPRPTLRYQVDQYTDFQHRRHEVLPGVTGWAQIQGRNELTWPERIELDVWYVENRSLALDLRILVKTLAVISRPDEVYNEQRADWNESKR